MKTLKKLWISILSVFAVVCFSLGVIFAPNVKVTADTPIFATSLSMKYGASVRINKTESYEDNGIRFSATISNEEYEVLRLMDNVVFGMFIMPESYVSRFGELTADNVNMGGVYDWKENKSDEYFYGGSEIQAESHRILAITYAELPDDKDNDGYKVINGSVVAIKDDNLDMNYVGRAFIRYEVDGFYFYEMANWSEGQAQNSVRSITGVAQKAIQDKNSNLTAEQRKALADSYTTKSLQLQGYEAVENAEDFAAMNADGKYYLTGDITVSSAYANEFTGVLNGNGKSVTVSGESVQSMRIDNVLSSGLTEDSTVAAPDGFETVYKTNGISKTNKSTLDISGYSEVTFAVKSTAYFLVNSWSVYFKESYTDWAPVVMKNNGDGTWEATIYADVFTGSAVANPYTVTYTGTSLNTLLGKWETSGSTTYVTELRANVPAGTSMFKSFSGTLTNMNVTASASLIEEMNGGLVDGLTVHYTYSESAPNAIAANSARIARIENCIVYTNDSKTDFVSEGGAFVSNCVETTDSTATYKEIVFATEDGQVKKFIKNGADVSNKYVYGAASTLAGKVNSWNKEFSTVNADTVYYATEYNTVYDSEAEWTKIIGSAITGAIAGNTPAPYGYENVNIGAMTWSEASIKNYTSVRFAVKMSGYFLLSGWTIYSDANDWMQIAMDLQEDGTWTVTVGGPVWDGSTWVDGYQKTGVTATTIAEAMSFVTFATYTTYATEVYGVEAEKVNYGTEIVKQAIAGSTETTAVTAPEGFTYAYEYASIPAGTSFASVDISGYSVVRFNMWLDKGYICIKSWGAYAENAGWGKQWVPITLTNNGDGTWTILIEALIAGAGQNPYSYSVSGSTLDAVLATWFDFASDSATIYITEVLGVEIEVGGGDEPEAAKESVVTEQALTGSTESQEAAPEGFTKVYSKSGFAKGDFANVSLDGYSSIRFMVKANGWILFNGWSSYIDKRNTWLEVIATCNDGQWTVTVAGTERPCVANGTTLNAIFANWYTDFGNSFQMYVTEVIGEEIPAWGEKIANTAFTGATESAEEVPIGYESVYAKSGFAKGDFADISLAKYNEIRFQVKATSWVLFGGWGTYYDKRAWIPWTLTKDESGSWTLRIDVSIGGASYYEEAVSGNTLKEALNKFYSDSGSITVYSTEVRATLDTTPVWGDKIINSALGNAAATDFEAPDKFENVYEKTDLSAGAFANINLSQYQEVRFWIKLNSGWMVLNNSWSTYYAHKDWTKVQLVNNNNGTWTLTWYTQTTNGSTTSESPFTATVSGTTLKAMLNSYYGDASTNAYVTELRGIKKDTPTVEVPDVNNRPVALAPQENTVLWGKQISANGAVGFEMASDVIVPNGYENVVAGQPATTANNDGSRVGEFFQPIDISAYAEVRFAFKSTSWMLFGGWGSYVHVPNEWISVKMSQTAANIWAVTVYAQNAVSGADPFTVTYSGSTLQAVLASWYNATGETFYVTDIRGVKEVANNSVVIDACAVASGVTLDTTVAAPEGFESVYLTSGISKTNKSTVDISGYSEVTFAVKSTKYFLINGWSVYFRESYTDWAPVVMKNNGDGSWTVTIYGEVYTGTAYANPYTVTYTGTTLNTLLSKWETSDATTYVTEVRGVNTGLKSDVKISNLVCTTVYNTADVEAPDGYENVYRKDGLEKGDFFAVDISSYSEVNFNIQSKSWILFGGWAGYIQTPNQWISVRLVNQGSNSWKVFVNGAEEKTLTYKGATLQAVLGSWYNDAGATFYVTELRGVRGTYATNQIKAIAMLQSDKTTNTKKAALELSSIIKELTGVELLIEYYNNLGELDANRAYLILGTMAASEVNASALTTDTGYIMKKVGSHVALYATTSDGMYNAVYGFLNTYFGVEFYTDGVMVYTDENPVIGGEATLLMNPSIDYAWAIDGLLTKSANGEFNWNYINRLGYSNIYSQIGGGSWHNFLQVISEEKYGANGTVAKHSEWFVTKTDSDGVSFKTLNIASYGDAIAAAVANEFAAMISETPSVDVWQFSAPDSVDSSFTANEYVAFMNKVAANLNGQISRRVNLMLLAYNATFAAPTTAFAPQTNVGFTVMAAPIGMNYYYGFDNTTFTDSNGHTNAWYLEQITAWSTKAEELYIWNYSVYFDNYFVPLDTITNMQSKYQAYANAGVKGIYDQGSGEANTTDWAELKVYLKAELAKNVNADVNALIEKFMKAYYGEGAAPYMMQLLNAQQAHYATIASKMRGGHMTRDSLFSKSYWGTSNSNSMLTEWYGYIQSALNATSDATMKARIQKESLTVRYLNQVLFNNSSYGGKPLTVTTVAGATATDSLAQIITDAKALGVTRFAEGQGWVCNDGTIIGTNNLKDGVIDNLA